MATINGVIEILERRLSDGEIKYVKQYFDKIANEHASNEEFITESHSLNVENRRLNAISSCLIFPSYYEDIKTEEAELILKLMGYFSCSYKTFMNLLYKIRVIEFYMNYFRPDVEKRPKTLEQVDKMMDYIGNFAGIDPYVNKKNRPKLGEIEADLKVCKEKYYKKYPYRKKEDEQHNAFQFLMTQIADGDLEKAYDCYKKSLKNEGE